MIPTRQRGMWQRGIVALHLSGRASQRRGYSRLTRVRKARFITINRNMGKRKMGRGQSLLLTISDESKLCLLNSSSQVEFITAFERDFGFEIFQIGTHTRHGRDFFAITENHGGVLRFQIPQNRRAVLAAAVTNIVDV